MLTAKRWKFRNSQFGKLFWDVPAHFFENKALVCLVPPCHSALVLPPRVVANGCTSHNTFGDPEADGMVSSEATVVVKDDDDPRGVRKMKRGGSWVRRSLSASLLNILSGALAPRDRSRPGSGTGRSPDLRAPSLRCRWWRRRPRPRPARRRSSSGRRSRSRSRFSRHRGARASRVRPADRSIHRVVHPSPAARRPCDRGDVGDEAPVGRRRARVAVARAPSGGGERRVEQGRVRTLDVRRAVRRAARTRVGPSLAAARSVDDRHDGLDGLGFASAAQLCARWRRCREPCGCTRTLSATRKSDGTPPRAWRPRLTEATTWRNTS